MKAIKMKIVTDTNILVSALIKSGKPKKLFDKIIEGKVELILSREIISEFNKVIRRSKFSRYVEEAEINSFITLLNRKCKVILLKSKFDEAIDKSDNTVLNTAYDGKVDCIVSGDEHLLNLKEFKGIKIVKVAEMLKLL